MYMIGRPNRSLSQGDLKTMEFRGSAVSLDMLILESDNLC